jgi:hypothetical protein
VEQVLAPTHDTAAKKGKRMAPKKAKSSDDKVISIGYTQSGSYDDDDYYELHFDQEETSAIIIHRWHYFRPRANKEGSEELKLSELKRECPAAYAKAIKILQAKGFDRGTLKKS